MLQLWRFSYPPSLLPLLMLQSQVPAQIKMVKIVVVVVVGWQLPQCQRSLQRFHFMMMTLTTMMTTTMIKIIQTNNSPQGPRSLQVLQRPTDLLVAALFHPHMVPPSHNHDDGDDDDDDDNDDNDDDGKNPLNSLCPESRLPSHPPSTSFSSSASLYCCSGYQKLWRWWQYWIWWPSLAVVLCFVSCQNMSHWRIKLAHPRTQLILVAHAGHGVSVNFSTERKLFLLNICNFVHLASFHTQYVILHKHTV